MMSASAPTVNTDIASDDEDDAELPLIDTFDAGRINNPLSNNRSISELTVGLVEIARVLSAYTDTLREPFGSTHHIHALIWVYRERYQGGIIHQPYPNAPIVLLFNWVQQQPGLCHPSERTSRTEPPGPCVSCTASANGISMPMSLFLCLPLGSQPPHTRPEPFPCSHTVPVRTYIQLSVCLFQKIPDLGPFGSKSLHLLSY
jgi:hypothetical protein